MAFDDGHLFATFLVLSNADWCELVKYQLTNSDLEENDPRLALVANLGIPHTLVEGYNGKGTRRLSLTPPIKPDMTTRAGPSAWNDARAKPAEFAHLGSVPKVRRRPSDCALCAAADCDLRDQQTLCPVPDRQR